MPFNKKAYRKRYYKEHKELEKKCRNDYYMAHKEKAQECTKNWKRKNKEHLKISRRNYREKNKNKENKARNNWRATHKDRVKSTLLKRNYGISLNQFNKILIHQKNHCAICSEFFVKTPHVDHNHKTGKIRGLLCSRCNLAIGFTRDNIVILENAIKYLRKYMEDQ